jgi:hypothetical protein
MTRAGPNFAQPQALPGPYLTRLNPIDEMQFQNWLQQNRVPFDPTPQADYDMRGYWKALQSGDPRARTQMNSFDGLPHFPDAWKTPNHATFSNESIYARPTAPHWNDDRLTNSLGGIVADETPKPQPQPQSQPKPKR